MTLYKHFVGIDMGKSHFTVAVHDSKTTKEFENNAAGIAQFISFYKVLLSDALCILEATGGYELTLLLTLCHKDIAVHRADARKVKNFIRSFGNKAKTDALDAKAMALYGYERKEQLKLYTPSSNKALELYELVQRRNDLKQMLVAEKNRYQAPKANMIKASCEVMIKALTKLIEEMNQAIDKLILEDEILSQKRKILETIPGIGKIVSTELLAMMPELGQMNRRQAACLAGLAPRANESGKFKGYRQVAPGRNEIKPMLFLAAMAARNSNTRLKDFYNHLVANGKKKMVALVALMRKIIVIANAKLKIIAI